jgi:hypothetical protein
MDLPLAQVTPELVTTEAYYTHVCNRLLVTIIGLHYFIGYLYDMKQNKLPLMQLRFTFGSSDPRVIRNHTLFFVGY